MEVVVTSDQMRGYDRYAIEKLQIPGILLMENAARGVVEAILKHYGYVSGKEVVVVCGKGNNGGDGLAVARLLHMQGASIKVILLAKFSEVKGDAKTNLDVLRNLSQKEKTRGELKIEQIHTAAGLKGLGNPDLIIDAILGTGFRGEVSGLYKKAIDAINKVYSGKVSIDVPSGLNADTGMALGAAVRSNLTITMGCNKTGLSLSKSREYTGLVEVVDLGFSSGMLPDIRPSTTRVHAVDIRKILPPRKLTVHKYSFKKILVLAGSRGFTGAAAMVANSALRSGAGMVVLGTPNSVYPVLARKLTEVMVEPMEETPEGTISRAAWEAVQKKIAWADVLVLGPGLSKNEETLEIVEEIVRTVKKPILIDADGLSAVPIESDAWKLKRKKDIIVTPHVGELSRLIHIGSNDIENNRIEIAREFAVKLGVTLVLKGAPTVTASADGDVYINSTGNPGMATPGMGDILSGIIAGLLAQNLDATTSAYGGVYLHGLAGDIACVRHGEKSLVATDLYDSIGEAFKKIALGVADAE